LQEMRGASFGLEAGEALKPGHLPPVTAFKQRIDARTKGCVMLGLAMGIDGRLIVIHLIQEEFVRIVRVCAQVELAASRLLFKRIARLDLQRLTHLIALPVMSFKIDYHCQHPDSLQPAISD